MRRSNSGTRSFRKRAQGKVLVGLHRRELERQYARLSDACVAWAEGQFKLGEALRRVFIEVLQDSMTRIVIRPLIRSMVAGCQPSICATTSAPLDRCGWLDRPGWGLRG